MKTTKNIYGYSIDKCSLKGTCIVIDQGKTKKSHAPSVTFFLLTLGQMVSMTKGSYHKDYHVQHICCSFSTAPHLNGKPTERP